MKLTTGYKKPIASSGTDALELSSNNSYLLLAGGGHKALSELVSPADLTNYVTIGSDQTITGVKTFSLAINADITGNADTLDGKHAIEFAMADHTHSYLPLAGGTLTGSVTMQGMNTNLVRNITHDNTGSWARNIIALSVDGVQKFAVSALGDYTLEANNNGITYAYIGCNEYDGLNLRITATSLSWGDNNILHAGNYNSYVPKLDGTGAIGTWGINISGNADTCDGLHVNTGYRNTEANKIVRTDESGYLQCGFINSSYGDEGNNSSPARVWGTNGSDSYLRTYLTSALSVGYATSAGNADTVNGYNITASNGKYFGKIPVIETDGVTELGRYIDFHYDTTTTSDYSTRLQVSGNHGNDVILPSESGTLALTSQIPTSLPANGGNADYAKSAGNADTSNRTKFLETFKQNSTTDTYGSLYPIWAQWANDTNVRLKCTNYTVWTDKADYATSAGNANTATSVDWSGVTNRPTSLPANGGNADYATSAGYSEYALSLNSITLPSSRTNSANTVWCKFATITFNMSAWCNAAGYFLFSGEEAIDYRGILEYHFRAGSSTTSLNIGELSWLTKSHDYASVIAVKAADNVYDLYVNNCSAYCSTRIYHFSANNSSFKWNVGSWTATKPTAAITASDVGRVYYATNAGSADTADSVDWSGITNKPSSFTPSSHNHTTSQITDFPTSLPANGGTSDYAKYLRGRQSDGTYYDDAIGNNIIAEWDTKSDNRWYLKAASTYECRVDYATSAGNADTVDGYHASDFATAGHTHNYAGSDSAGGSANLLKGSYTLNGGKQMPNYFGRNTIGALMMNTSINGNSEYKDFFIMDCYHGDDVGGAVALGVNRQSLGAYIMRSAAERTSWEESAELLGTHNYTSYTVKKDGTGATGTWGINISGNAASAGSVAWDNVSNKPTSLPANGGNADYAESAGNAGTLGGYTADKFIQNITVRNVITGAPGTNAEVKATKTNSDVILDFTIPQGYQGDMAEKKDNGYTDSNGDTVVDYCEAKREWQFLSDPGLNCEFVNILQVPIPSYDLITSLIDCINMTPNVTLAVGDKGQTYTWNLLHWSLQCSNKDGIVYVTKYGTNHTNFYFGVDNNNNEAPINAINTIEIVVRCQPDPTDLTVGEYYIQVTVENKYGRAYYTSTKISQYTIT